MLEGIKKIFGGSKDEGAPKVEDTTATINNVEKTGKKITFSYAPYTFKNAEYKFPRAARLEKCFTGNFMKKK